MKARKMELTVDESDRWPYPALLETELPLLDELNCEATQYRIMSQFLGGASTTLTALHLDITYAPIDGFPNLLRLRNLSITTQDVNLSAKDPRHYAMLLNTSPAL